MRTGISSDQDRYQGDTKARASDLVSRLKGWISASLPFLFANYILLCGTKLKSILVLLTNCELRKLPVLAAVVAVVVRQSSVGLKLSSVANKLYVK